MALRGDDDSVGWVHDRLVLLVPAHAVVLMPIAAEQLDDLSASSWLTVQPPLLDPVAYLCTALVSCRGLGFTSSSISIRSAASRGIGVRR